MCTCTLTRMHTSERMFEHRGSFCSARQSSGNQNTNKTRPANLHAQDPLLLRSMVTVLWTRSSQSPVRRNHRHPLSRLEGAWFVRSATAEGKLAFSVPPGRTRAHARLVLSACCHSRLEAGCERAVTHESNHVAVLTFAHSRSACGRMNPTLRALLRPFPCCRAHAVFLYAHCCARRGARVRKCSQAPWRIEIRSWLGRVTSATVV